MNNRIRNLVFISLCATIVTVSKEMIAFIANIELVTFLFILFGRNFRLSDSIMIAVVFCFLQLLLYGVDIWTYMYFVVWILLVVIANYTKLLFNTEQKVALFSGGFGLIFGFLFSIPYFVISFKMGWIYFIKGIPFDLVHGIANYIIMLILFERCDKVIKKLVIKHKI